MAFANKGRFVWYEHLARDVQPAIAFYREVVGWKTEAFGQDGYTMWVGSQGPLGGVMPLAKERPTEQGGTRVLGLLQRLDLEIVPNHVIVVVGVLM